MRPRTNAWHAAICAQFRAAGTPLTVAQVWEAMVAAGFRHQSAKPRSTLGARIAELVQAGKLAHVGPSTYRWLPRLKVIVDGDGFLVDFVGGVLRTVREVTGREHAREDVTRFDVCAALGLSEEEALFVNAIITSRRGFCTALPPYPGARRCVDRLRLFGDVMCVTAPWPDSPWWSAERASWMALHMGIGEVYSDAVKSSYEADVFVDDSAAHVAAWLRRWPGRCGVFWRTPHNTGEAVPVDAHSIGSYDALVDLVAETHRALVGRSDAGRPIAARLDVVHPNAGDSSAEAAP